MHAHTHTHTYTHTHTHTHTHTEYQTLMHILLIHSLTHTHILSFTPTHTCRLTHTHLPCHASLLQYWLVDWETSCMVTVWATLRLSLPTPALSFE